MADTTVNIGGHPIKLVDNLDGTFSFNSSGSSSGEMEGKAADSAAVSGNPVLLAGKYSATPATRHEGDAVTLQTTATGSLLTSTQLTGTDSAIAIDLQGCAIPDTEPVPVRSVGIEANDTIIISHTADAHDAGDSVSTAAGENLLFASLGVSGDHILITDITIRYNQSGIPTNSTGHKLHLFNAEPTPIASDSPHNVVAADLDKYLGYIVISQMADVGDNCISINDGLSKRVKLAGTSLYGQLQCIAGETPAIDSVFTIILGGMKL